MPAKKDPDSYKQLTTTQRKQARTVRRLHGEDAHRQHVTSETRRNLTIWAKKGMAVKDGHLHPIQKKTTRISPAQRKLLKGVRKVFGATINHRPLKDYLKVTGIKAAAKATADDTRHVLKKAKLSPKGSVDGDNEWHTSDLHMRQYHGWTIADCDYDKQAVPLPTPDSAARATAELRRSTAQPLAALHASNTKVPDLRDKIQEYRELFEELGETAGEAALLTNADLAREKSIYDKERAQEFLVQTDKRHDPTIHNLWKEEEAKRMAQSKAKEQAAAQCCPQEVRKPGPIRDQMEELGKSLYVASEMLGKLEDKLQPVRFVPPRPADDAVKANERSGVFNDLVQLTVRANDLCRRIGWLEEEIEL